MLLLSRIVPRYSYLLAVSLAYASACGTSESGGFDDNGQGGTVSKGGNTSVASTVGGSTSAETSTTPTSNAGSPSTSTVTEVVSDGGVIVPDSSVVEDPDTYESSCTEEVCKKDEACFDKCPNGSCCVHACEGQTGTTSAVVTCCDRMGGIIPGASCK